jgi:hypothetical protein
VPSSALFRREHTARNDERMVYLYDAKKGIEVREQVGEVAIEPSALRHIKLPGVAQSFNGFDRNPFLASFRFKNAKFSLANVHLYFGDASAKNIQRRQLETFAVVAGRGARIVPRPPTTRQSLFWATSIFHTWRTTIRSSRY